MLDLPVHTVLYSIYFTSISQHFSIEKIHRTPQKKHLMKFLEYIKLHLTGLSYEPMRDMKIKVYIPNGTRETRWGECIHRHLLGYLFKFKCNKLVSQRSLT